MQNTIDLDRYPLDKPHSPAWSALVAECRARLAADGLFSLPGFVRDDALAAVVDELKPVLEERAFVHARRHNIYFSKCIDGLPAAHPALQEFETSNRTICADQIGHAIVIQLYEWVPFAE
ncbi:MAG: 2OG-Fe(II) oxygenase, partial [Pseudomonadota bacterium]